MAKIDASSKEDVKLLATCFYTIPIEDKWKIVAKTYDLKLMKFRGLGFPLWLANKIKGKTGVYQFFKILSEKAPDYIDNCIEDTIRHIVNGKDTTDPASVGGWSQKEIDLLLDNVTFSLLRDRS
jgi:hypothetical protein